MDNTEIEFLDIEENKEYIDLINLVVNTCFNEEKMEKTNLYLNVILTNPKNIRKANKTYRNIDKETDVLSFPMFEKNEIDKIIKDSSKENDKGKLNVRDVLGDIIISVPRVIEQAEEYGHSAKREMAYMVVHGFYHVMGYDHIKEEDKVIMRPKEENILDKLHITRD